MIYSCLPQIALGEKIEAFGRILDDFDDRVGDGSDTIYLLKLGWKLYPGESAIEEHIETSLEMRMLKEDKYDEWQEKSAESDLLSVNIEHIPPSCFDPVENG